MANVVVGAIVSLYNTGQALGTFITGYSADRFSRRWTICAAGIICKGKIGFYSMNKF
jgi:MFS family permease